MDAYNRGYNPGISGLGTSPIGNATVVLESNITPSSEDAGAGFYAIAYNTSSVSGFSSGERTIAYRGTDSLIPDGEIGGDVWNAYGIGAGSPDGAQAALAIKFYQAVAGLGANLQTANVSVTGHSAGGALAGLVGGLYGKDGALFDNMAFEGAANVAFGSSQFIPTSDPNSYLYNEALKTLIYGSADPWAVNFSGLLTRYVQGEFLLPNRLTQDTPQVRLDMDLLTSLHLFERHSQSLLIVLQYANEVLGPDGDWARASRYFLPHLFDESIASLVVPDTLKGTDTSKLPDILRDAIAYSAIDEGTRVFGDTGIRALFDDAGDLGKVLALSNASQTVKDSVDGLGKIFTQFAGQLAIGQVLQAEHSEALAGVLSLSADEQTLAVDFSDELWSLGRSNGPQTEIIGRADLTNQVFAQAFGEAGQPSATDVGGGMKWLWNANDSSIIDRIVFATSNEALTTALADRGYPSSKVSLFAASGSNDDITGSEDNDFIVGGDGDDVISGGIGKDLLVGGEGDDRFNGGADRDYFAGGAGEDTVFYAATGGSGIQLTIEAVADEASGGVPTLSLVTSTDGTDRAKGIEIVELSDKKDTVHVGNGLSTLSGTVLIDAGGQAAGQRDVLDFSGLNKVFLKQGTDDALYLSKNNFLAGEIPDAVLGVQAKYLNFEEVSLTSGDDKVDIQSGVRQLNTGGGDDVVKSSGIGMTIDLGTGNDTLEQSGPGTIVYTGSGEDRIEISHNGQMLVTDASTLDRMTMYGIELTGGIHWHASSSPYAFGLLGERYGRNQQGDLVIKDWSGNETFIANFNFAVGGTNLTAGIYVIDLEVSFVNIMHVPEDFDLLDTWEALMGHAMKALIGHSAWGTAIDPLVFDLNGDGITLSLREANNALFDMDKDGFGEHVGWVRGGDGFLVRDINENGAIDNIGEMFGNVSQSGFVHLAELDGNHDGKVDAADDGLADFNKDGVTDSEDTFDTLKMWIDANEDGNTDASELVSLDSLGISSISVSSTPSGTTSVGNTIVATGTFTRTDGTTGTVAHVDFKIDDFNTKWLGDDTVSVEAATRANLKGHGTLADLHVAMTIDPALATVGQPGAPLTLIEIVDANLAALNVTDLATLREAARPILVAWANAVPVPVGTTGQGARADFNLVLEETAEGSVVRDFLIQKSDQLGTYWGLASGNVVRDENGAVIARPTREQVLESVPEAGSWTVLDGDDIRFLERYLGDAIDLDVTSNPGAQAIAAATTVLNFAWHQLDKIAVRLASQGPLESFFAGVEYDAVTDLFKPTTSHQLVPMLEAIFTATPSETSAAEVFIADWKDVIDVMMPDFQRSDGLDVTFAYLFQNLVGAYENVPISLTLQQAASVLDIPQDIIKTGAGNLTGTNQPDLFYLDSSDQYAQGKAGYDAYIVGRDFGHDVIQDVWEGLGHSQEDSIRFAHLNANDLTFRRDGLDLVITQNGTDNEIRVVDEFAGRRPGLISAYQDFDKSIEIITFADGTVWDKIDIAKAVGELSYSTDDTLLGTPDVDVLNGGTGTDYMSGGDAGDHYMFGRGDGHDTIQDNQSYVWMETPDFVHFGENISQSDISFQRTGNSENLQISIAGTDDVLTINQQFRLDYGLFNTTINRIEVFTFADGRYVGWEDVIKTLNAEAGTDGDDVIYGFDYTDTLDGGLGNDFLSGGNESDTYIFGLGYGHDTIHDDMGSILASDTDVVLFKDIAYGDVTFQHIGNSDSFSILVDGTEDVLTIEDQFLILYGLVNVPTDRIEQFEFSDGTILSWEDVIQNFNAAATTDGDDAIYGFAYADTLVGGEGNDTLAGGREDDTYVYNRGDGHDIIVEVADAQTSAFDTLVLHGVTPASVSIMRDGNDITLMVAESSVGAGDAGSIKLKNESDNFFSVGVEQIVFDDETVWTQDNLREMLIAQASTSGNDTIIGFNVDDTFRGGSGNDAISGGAGDDTYIYARGDGQDVIIEGPSTSISSIDTLVLEGLNPSDVSLVRNGRDVTLMIAESAPGIGDSGSILLKDAFDDYFRQGLETVSFANGTIWTQADLREMLLAQASTSGNDTIVGFNTDDTLRGGVGNDAISGTEGDDTYIYARGDGHDVITEIAGGNYSTIDTLLLEGLNPSDVTLARNGNDLTLIIVESAPGVGDGGSILLKDEINDFFSRGVEKIKFADGTIWTQANIRQMLISTAGTPGDDVITGTSASDIIAGGGGNDTLNGGVGDDIYIYSRGDGNDVITEAAAAGVSNFDTLSLNGISPSDVSLVRNGIQLTLVIAESAAGAGDGGSIVLKDELDDYLSQGVEQVAFSDGTVWTRADLRLKVLAQSSTSGDDAVTGFNTNDVIAGGGGNDAVNGGVGNDTYVYSRGDGNDVITEVATSGVSNFDTLSLNGISPSDVSLVRNGIQLTLVIAESVAGAGDGGSIVLKDELDDYLSQGVEQVTFSDGTIWTRADLRLKVLAQSSTSGDDVVTGFNTSDVITGGGGNDAVNGGVGNDTYVYSRGDGNDVITEVATSGVSNFDTLSLNGISPSDVGLVRNGIHLTLVIAESAAGADDGGSIVLKDELDDYLSQGVEQVAFSDGTVWTRADLRLKVLAQSSTSGDDVITGFNTNDVITAGGGNDTVNGGAGNDTYVYSRGDGNDIIDDQGSFDTNKLVLHGVEPSELTVVRNGNNIILLVGEGGVDGRITVRNQLTSPAKLSTVEFDNGTTWTAQTIAGNAIANDGTVLTHLGTSGADTIDGTSDIDVMDGGAGNDLLRGAVGSDTYLWGAGSGNDTITDNGGVSDVDTIRLIGLNSTDVSFGRLGNQLSITVIATGEVLKIQDHFNGTASGIEQIKFADSTTWDRAQIQAASWFIGTSAGETINGTAAAEVFDGKGGNDQVNGGGGADTYLFGVGSGNDTVVESNTDAGADAVKLIGLNVADVLLGRSGNDLLIQINSSGETLKVTNQFNGTYGVEQLVFADNTTWDRSQIQSAAWIFGTATAETIHGSASAEVIDGKGGNDQLYGHDGGDTYVYGLGSANDTINESNTETGTDIVQLVGLNGSDVLLSRSGNDLFVKINSSGETLKVANQFNTTYGIEQLSFADGTSWGRTQIQDAAWILGTSGNDTLSGSSGNDIFSGGLGNDQLNGTAGSDTYVYANGDGNDYINESSGSTADVDVLRLTNLNASDLTFGRVGLHLVVTVNSNGQTITIDEQFFSQTANWGIEKVEFANGDSWNLATINANAWYRGTAGADTISASSNNDTILGGLGNDTVNGALGSDTYVYASGDGNDYINESSGSTADVDVLRLTNLNASDLTFSRVGLNLVMTVNSNGQTITIDEQFYSQTANWGIEKIEFANGDSWNLSTIKANAWYRGTAGNDTIVGSSDNDTISGGLGNDLLNGAVGGDTFVYASGDGNDYINESTGSTSDTDVLRLTDLNASDLTFSRVGLNLVATVNSNGQTITFDEQFYSQAANWGVEKIEFANSDSWNLSTINTNAWYRGTSGNDTMTGSVWNDTLAGGAGNDVLSGGAGNDTFVFRTGLGQDTVTDYAAGLDVLEFRDGIFEDAAAALAAATASGNNTLITIDANNSILLQNVSLANLHTDDFDIV